MTVQKYLFCSSLIFLVNSSQVTFPHSHIWEKRSLIIILYFIIGFSEIQQLISTLIDYSRFYRFSTFSHNFAQNHQFHFWYGKFFFILQWIARRILWWRSFVRLEFIFAFFSFPLTSFSLNFILFWTEFCANQPKHLDCKAIRTAKIGWIRRSECNVCDSSPYYPKHLQWSSNLCKHHSKFNHIQRPTLQLHFNSTKNAIPQRLS